MRREGFGLLATAFVALVMQKEEMLHVPDQSNHANEREEKPFPKSRVVSVYTPCVNPGLVLLPFDSDGIYLGFNGSPCCSQAIMPFSRSVIGYVSRFTSCC